MPCQGVAVVGAGFKPARARCRAESRVDEGNRVSWFSCIHGTVYTPPMVREKAVSQGGMAESDNATREAVAPSRGRGAR